MRHNFAVSVLFVLLLALALLLTGCCLFAHPGQTAAEVHRDHLRTLRVNQQEMMSDIDRTLGVDQPSKLTDKKIP
jgi:outer membrane biogenesis lipoprotein LolB